MESDINSSFPWIDYLLSYFKKLKELDDEIEKIRVSLCEISQFSPLSLFEYLDIDSKSFLTLNDFKSFLRTQNSAYDERKLRKMIHNFDKDNDFSLNLDEFLGLILPRKNLGLQKNMLSIVNTYNSNNKNIINHEMELNLNNLILRELQLIEELDEISGKIKSSKLFSTYEAFLAIVIDEKYMTKLNLYNFLKKNGVFINDEEVSQLMFRLDADNDDRISYEEFKEMFYPIKEDYVYSQKDNNYISNFNRKYENNNNYNNNITNTEKDNEYNDYDYNDENYDNKDFEDYNNTNINNEKKGKKTKKVVLKKGKNNNSNLFHSQDSNNNYLRNNQQESYSKFPNINNHNSTDNYTLNNRTSKCKICTFSKNDYYNNKEPFFNEINYEKENYKSEFSQNNVILRKRNNSTNKYNYSNNYDNDNNERKSYESGYTLKTRNKKFISPNNDYNNDIDDNRDSMNCRACLYSAKNIYNNYRNKSNSNSSNNKYTNFNNHYKTNNNNNRFKYKNDMNNNNNNQLNDIYKRKEELIKKYCNNDNNGNNYIFNSEENISNRCFSSPKKLIFDNNNNSNQTPQLSKTITTEKRYISNNSNFSTAFNSNNNYNNENKSKTVFTERCQGIKDYDNYRNKIPFSNLSQFKKINIKGNNINERKKLFYQLLINYIEQDKNLETIKKGEKSIDEIKNMISEASDNIFYDLFGELKKENKPGIQRDDIDKFMKGNGYDIKDYEIEIIMGKMDKNKDDIIDYEEFISEIQPKHI